MNFLSNKTLEDISFSISRELQLFKEAYHKQFNSEEDFLKPVLGYIENGKGKLLRPIMFFLSQGLVRHPNPDNINLAVLIELFHTATLIHDDVVDGASERRGMKTLSTMWSNSVSVLFGDYLLAKVLSLGVETNKKEVLKIISRVVLEMGKGELRQALEKEWKKITLEDYYKMICEKTSSLFGAACELGGLEATISERNRLRKFGETFGMAFQIHDDILDFSGETDIMGKQIGQDVLSGKITIPLIFALSNASNQESHNLYKKMESRTEESSAWIKEFVESRGGIWRAKQEAELFAEKALIILETFQPSVYREAMEKLVLFDQERDN